MESLIIKLFKFILKIIKKTYLVFLSVLTMIVFTYAILCVFVFEDYKSYAISVFLFLVLFTIFYCELVIRKN